MDKTSFSLSGIVASKKREISTKKRSMSLTKLRALVREERESISLSAALTGRLNIIAEIKRKSPSSNSQRRNLDPVEMARLYESSGAAAISVLTDGPYFGTTVQDLIAVREAVKVPVLRKDFIIEEYQILESWLVGTDALLLISRILSSRRLKALLEMTLSLGMESLVEVHDEQDLESALEAGAHIIGINNRDLGTLRVDLSTTERLAPKVPKDRLVVSESGICDRQQIERFDELGVRAFLVGQSLLNASSPEVKLGELLGRSQE
jgi:indole-3-glycerol phosphate synthase